MVSSIFRIDLMYHIYNIEINVVFAQIPGIVPKTNYIWLPIYVMGSDVRYINILEKHNRSYGQKYVLIVVLY